MKRISYKKLNHRIIIWCWFILPSIFLLNCRKSEYQRTIEKEIANGARHDSLFLGLHFGMQRKDFFARCMELNRQHITLMGIKGNMVLRTLEDSVGTIYMHFYPNFENDAISEMQVLFTYRNWSPFVRTTQPDSLLLRSKRRLEAWYGKGFLKVARPEYDDFAYVKVDGNRQIAMFVSGETDVKVLFTDLSVKHKKE